MLDIVMMRLRTADGLDLDDFGHRYGSGPVRLLLRALEPHESAQLALRERAPDRKEGALGTLRLADPEGFLLSNDVISDIFAELLPAEDEKRSNAL
jgi:oxygen-independent coproporphyrinogen-3 oxidase